MDNKTRNSGNGNLSGPDHAVADVADEPSTGHKTRELGQTPPFIWPEARWHVGLGEYDSRPPFDVCLAKADLVAGVVVDAGSGFLDWLHRFLNDRRGLRLVIVLILYPACETKTSHLTQLLRIQRECNDENLVELNILPLPERYGLPPTVIQGHNAKSGETWLSIGSIGDFGAAEWHWSSFNAVFHPDDVLRNEWRRWFEYIRQSSVLLTPETADIPDLIPAVGDPEAAELWRAYEALCAADPTTEQVKVEVNAESGEIVVTEGEIEEKNQPWDGGATALDELAKHFNEIYSNGWLVTVDEATRIKPLAIPVKAALLGQKSEESVGAVRRKQSFTLEVLDKEDAKEIEKCRRVADLMDLVSYLLSKGNRFLPAAAKPLLEKELDARNKRGIEKLTKAVGGDTQKYVEGRKNSLTKDLNQMYGELGMGDKVPEDKLAAILSEVERRLKTALASRVTPKATYNRIAAPDLTGKAPDDNWSQPFSLMLRATRLMRSAVSDNYFPRNFSKTAFKQDEFVKAMNVFGDSTPESGNFNKAREELERIDEIESDTGLIKEKCQALWQLISEGKLAEEQNSQQPQGSSDDERT